MVSIVTAYYNRKKLFIRTLESIAKTSVQDSFEVIVVDDGSYEEERLEDLVSVFPFLRVIRLDKKDKWYSNSCIPFNVGFNLAKGDKIIIQNPECLHYDDILKYTHENLKSNEYLSFGCYSLDKQTTNNLDDILLQNKQINNVIKKGGVKAEYDGDSGWYNHSLHRPAGYHFCTAITKKDLIRLGGFDERFSLGIAYDDDEFLKRLKIILKIIFVDTHIVLHQNHYGPKSTSYENRSDKYKLISRNKFAFNNKSKIFSRYRANLIAKHLPLPIKKYWITIFVKTEMIYFKCLNKLKVKFLKKSNSKKK